MKILYIVNQLALHGGTERVTALKISELVKRNYDVYLSTYEQCGRPFVYNIPDKIQYVDLGVNYNVDFINRSLYSLRPFMKVPKHIWRTFRLLKNTKPDIIIVPYAAYEFWFIPFIKGSCKIIREYHGSEYKRPLTRWNDKKILTNLLDDIVQRKYNRGVVLTPQEKEYFKYDGNLEVIPNPIEESILKTNQNSKSVITIGRIAPVKGYDKFIDLAEMVHKCCPDWTFEIYGGGPDEFVEPLKNQIYEKGLENVVIMKGETNDAYKVLSRASIYVCTSLTESFGLSLVEAMEAGLPVVSFDCPNGPRNIINNGCDGYLVANGDISSMCSKVIQLINDDGLRNQMSINAIKNAKRFHIEKVMDLWCELFSIVLQEK